MRCPQGLRGSRESLTVTQKSAEDVVFLYSQEEGPNGARKGLMRRETRSQFCERRAPEKS